MNQLLKSPNEQHPYLLFGITEAEEEFLHLTNKLLTDVI